MECSDERELAVNREFLGHRRANLQQKLLLFCYFLLSIRVIPTFSNFSTYSFTSGV